MWRYRASSDAITVSNPQWPAYSTRLAYAEGETLALKYGDFLC